jgi:hypothetical protein
MTDVDELRRKAEIALAEACAMPWGPERIEALRVAGSLRNDAANRRIALDGIQKTRGPDSRPLGRGTEPPHYG